MAAAKIGLFGSNVGAGSKYKPLIEQTPVPKVSKLAAAHASSSFHWHAPTLLHPTEAQDGLSHKATDPSHFSGTIAYGTGGSAGGAGQSSGGGGLLSDVAGGVEGFIGHLGSDIVHTALGFPVGIAYMIQHPISGVEESVKATWNDWSPLFHGNVRLWLHNTYEHPLAPILDVAGVASGGAALAARGAVLVGVAGETAEAADAAVAASETTARAASSAAQAAQGGRFLTKGARIEAQATAVGEQGAQASELYTRLQKFGAPGKYAEKTYASVAKSLGYTNEDDISNFVQTALNNDGTVRRTLTGPGDMKYYREVSHNPWNRVTEKMTRRATDAIASTRAAKSIGIDNIMGSDAAFRKAARVDSGARHAAVTDVIRRQFKVLDQMGNTLSHLLPSERLKIIEPAMRKGLVSQADRVTIKGAVGDPGFDSQVKELTKAVAEGGAGKQFIKDDAFRGAAMNAAYKHVDKAGEQGYNDFLNDHWAKANTTDNPAEAMRDANGNYLVASRPNNIGKEALGSSRVVQLLYKNPMAVWRWTITGASPKTFVNNFVGNSAMLMASTDPVTFFKALGDFIRTDKGMGKAFDDHVAQMAQAGAGPEDIARARSVAEVTGKNWMTKHFAGEYSFAGSDMRVSATGDLEEKPGTLGAALNKYSLRKVTHKYADMPQRMAGLQYTMKRMPEYQGAYARLRAAGASHFEADNQAAELAARNPAVRQLVRHQVAHMFGQYHTFTKFERSVKNVVPFYAWDRAIATHMKMLVTQQVYKVAMGAAIGTLGNMKTQQIMGEVPDFMLSAIPAKLLSGPLQALIGKTPGRMGVLNAYSLNPYGSIGDMANVVTGLIGANKLTTGQSLGTTLNPLITGAAAQLSGTDPTTGATVKPSSGGPLVGIYQNAFGTIPQAALVEALLGAEGARTTKGGYAKLYAKNLEAPLSKTLGFPVEQVNLGTAHYDAQQQNGSKAAKPKKNRNLDFPGL